MEQDYFAGKLRIRRLFLENKFDENDWESFDELSPSDDGPPHNFILSPHASPLLLSDSEFDTPIPEIKRILLRSEDDKRAQREVCRILVMVKYSIDDTSKEVQAWLTRQCLYEGE